MDGAVIKNEHFIQVQVKAKRRLLCLVRVDVEHALCARQKLQRRRIATRTQDAKAMVVSVPGGGE